MDTSRKPGPVRIQDVAAKAGISAITVSRVLHQPAQVAAGTRARVHAAIEALGYIPDLAASALASRRSGIVGVLVPTIANSVFSETVAGLSDALADTGLQTLLGDYGYSADREAALLRAMLGRRAEAIVAVGLIRDPALRRMLRASGVPVVETWDLADDPIDLMVGFSNEAAGAAMGHHLLVRHYRHIAFVGGADERAAARFAGLRRVIAPVHGATLTRLDRIGDLSIEAGRAGLAALLDRPHRLDAVFFASDVLAAGGLLEAAARGLSVPRQIAIAGLGDLEIGRALSPPLTTLRIHAHEMGRRAGEMLTRRLAGEAVPGAAVDVGFELVVRAST